MAINMAADDAKGAADHQFQRSPSWIPAAKDVEDAWSMGRDRLLTSSGLRGHRHGGVCRVD